MRAAWALLLLAGCNPAPTPIKAPERPITLVQPPSVTSVQDGEILTVQVPVKNHGNAVEHQSCFIFRDHKYQTSTMQCPNDRTGYTFDGQ